MQKKKISRKLEFIAILFLMFFHFIMEKRVGEFSPDNRAMFNIGHYVFAGIMLFSFYLKSKANIKIVVLYWSVMFFYWAAAEIVYTRMHLEVGDYKMYIAIPLIVWVIYKNGTDINNN